MVEEMVQRGRRAVVFTRLRLNIRGGIPTGIKTIPIRRVMNGAKLDYLTVQREDKQKTRVDFWIFRVINPIFNT